MVHSTQKAVDLVSSYKKTRRIIPNNCIRAPQEMRKLKINIQWSMHWK